MASQKVQRDTSNFVWNSHGLLVELIENTHWYWDASADSHGSTIGKLAIDYPKEKLNPTFMMKFADEAQWTRVSTIPKRVVDASQTYTHQ
jgi:hypothetical protein